MSDNRYIKAKAAASPAAVGATLMKTGQTTSYATGDDGATQRGRLTNFTTLPSNNPFGTTNRFTNKTGGQTYTNSVAYDWSTYDGSTVLAYYFGDLNSRTWSAQLTQHTASTFDGLTGWNLTNFVEMTNIMNFSLLAAFMLNYAPFSTNRRYFWISTSPSGSAGISTDLASVGCFASSNKANTNGGIWVRKCNVSGTTIS
jgi:hypothetical protein